MDIEAGMEAASLRKLLVFAVLLGGAFLGGTIATGARPPWLQLVLKYVAPKRAGEAHQRASEDSNATQQGQSSSGIPAAPVPPLATDGSPSSLSDNPAVTHPISSSAVSSHEKALSSLVSTDEGMSVVVPAVNANREAMPEGSKASTLAPVKRVRASGWEDAPNSAPAVAALPNRGANSKDSDSEVQLSSTAQSPTSNPVGSVEAARVHLSQLMHRMADIGVTRYWVEGGMEGDVVFRCLVPLGGDGTIGQVFEAAGKDFLDAADRALRRAIVWKAAEGQ